MTQDIFLTRQMIVGTRYVGGSDELVEELTPGSRVNLLHETDNRFDSRAVMVIDAKGRKLGYLPRYQNAIVCALLDAGRHFYGLITEKPERTSNDEDAPYQLYIDLYLRDYVNPEEMTSVPRQGDLGSYAVISVGLSASDGEDREKYIGRIAALKIINGEERGYFERELPEEHAPDDRREMLRLFHEFTGFLPFVSHGIEGVKRRILEEAYGTLLGEAFSNHVIDTAKMAKLQIPEIRNTSLTSYAKELGIECEAVTEAEEECRLTWKFYQRLERSELERVPELNIRMTLLEELYENDEISIRVYKSLKRAGIIMLGDLMDRS
ncbi:MAG: hypothetical protein J6D53_03070, partial [Blautia sp.]|nr:hypothetical protein [Blautia sp.]